MLTPTKHGDLQKNAIVIASELLSLLGKKNYNIDELYRKVSSKRTLPLDIFNDALVFLYLIEAIELKESTIYSIV
ncbi:ABC-three component system middle component 6 [Hymenobacter terrenus]|uniref:ABC-three component system middle component 6 n=1 Tax=Hymenobacter terrenus TaxID=1629124 RepID=UPI000619DCFB|nr:ABC-three component system middle component 6 [Hymenobacter terrenus]